MMCMAPLSLALLIGNYALRLTIATYRRAGGRWRWLVLPIVLLLILSCLFHPWPLLLRFELSRSALEEKAIEIQRTGSSEGPQRLGLYWVLNVRQDTGSTVQFTTGSSIIDPVGFVFDPSPLAHYEYHISDNWYWTEW